MGTQRTARTVILQSLQGRAHAFHLSCSRHFLANLDDPAIRVEHGDGRVGRRICHRICDVDTVEVEHLAVFVGQHAKRNIKRLGQCSVCAHRAAGDNENAGDDAAQLIVEICEITQQCGAVR